MNATNEEMRIRKQELMREYREDEIGVEHLIGRMSNLQDVYGEGQELKLVTPAYPLHIRKEGVDLFTLHPNGDIYVRGVLTHDDAAIVRGLRACLAAITPQSKEASDDD